MNTIDKTVVGSWLHTVAICLFDEIHGYFMITTWILYLCSKLSFEYIPRAALIMVKIDPRLIYTVFIVVDTISAIILG